MKNGLIDARWLPTVAAFARSTSVGSEFIEVFLSLNNRHRFNKVPGLTNLEHIYL
jgi:hypothetical protein